jgi:hypothetical protein
MSFTDYLLSAVLILVVFRQLRGRRLSGFFLFLPLVIVAVFAVSYFKGVPTSGNDPLLVMGGVLLGAALGTLCAVFTRIYPGPGGVPYAKATWLAVVFWILGVSGRLAFALYAEHGGGANIARFSLSHQLTEAGWVSGLILMALVEVVSRTGVLVLRTYRQLAHGAPAIISDREG